MADRIKLLIQKRTSLKSQITNLTNLFEKGKLENVALKLRMARLTELYNAFEEYNDELTISVPDTTHQTEFTHIQDRFYTLAGQVEDFLSTTGRSSASTSTLTETSRDEHTNTTAPVQKRRIKLPEAPLPSFDGKYENWLSFKNAFHNMIGSRTDLSEIDKLHYLKSALIGDAASKIKIFAVNEINYSKAWELLERAYEVKRILISRHLSLILNSSVLEKETTGGLSKLADDTQQHIASLNALGVSVGSEMIIHILEGKLPRHTLEKWEATLERDEVPTLEQLYEFLYKTAVCVSKRERSKLSDTEKNKGDPSAKRKRIQSPNTAFVLNASRNCIACKTKRHSLYLCDTFKQMSVQKRIDTVRNAKVCYNCLRSHRDSPCKFSSCTICQKRHNTLLHLEGYASAHKSDAAPSDNVKNS